MTSSLLTGLVAGLTLIIAIGAQNAYVLRQGLRREHVGVVVAMSRREQAARWLAGLGERVVALGSLEAKGLEYDATLVVSPAEIADESPAGLRVLYVALTRATQQLTVLSGERDEPDGQGVPDLLRE